MHSTGEQKLLFFWSILVAVGLLKGLRQGLSPCPEQSHLCSQDWAFMVLGALNGSAQVSPKIALTSRREDAPASSWRNMG